MRLSEMFPQLEMAVPYHPVIAKSLKLDPTTCILFAQLWWLSEHRDSEGGWFAVTMLEIGENLALSTKVQRRARKTLVQAGLIEERLSTTLQFRVDLSELARRLGAPPERCAQREHERCDQREHPDPAMCPLGADDVTKGNIATVPPRKKEQEEKASVQPLAPDLGLEQGGLFGAGPVPIAGAAVTFDEVLSGTVDAWTRARLQAEGSGVMRALLDRWALLWRKKGAVKLTTRRKQAFAKALKTYAPSEFAKALLGMSWDPWSERRHNCDWHCIERDVEGWRDLYEEHRGQPLPMSAAGAKIVKGVTVPQSYSWTDADDYAVGQGWTFDFATARWTTERAGAACSI